MTCVTMKMAKPVRPARIERTAVFLHEESGDDGGEADDDVERLDFYLFRRAFHRQILIIARLAVAVEDGNGQPRTMPSAGMAIA